MRDQYPAIRVIFCGAAGSGKSTLIEKMLGEAEALAEDQLDTAKHGFALLLGDLSSQSKRDFSNDVTQRTFATKRRRMVVCEAPTNEGYTRNIATTASLSDLAVVMVDATQSVVTQTREHTLVASLLGIQHVVLAVNKLDLVSDQQEAFEAIDSGFRAFTEQLDGITHVETVPLSATRGDNVSIRAAEMEWYQGPTLMEYLDGVVLVDDTSDRPFRMPVHEVGPGPASAEFLGRVASGSVKAGDAIKALPLAKEAVVLRVVASEGEIEEAAKSQTVTLALDRELELSRGDVLAAAEQPPEVANQFETTLIWMSEDPLLAGRSYAVKIGALRARATVTTIKHRINVDTMEELAANNLSLDQIAHCNITIDRRIPFDAYRDNKTMGGFVLIDRLSREIVGVGLINFALRRSSNVHLQNFDVDRNARAALKGQRQSIVWFTGLSGSGKSTIANIVEQKLLSLGYHTVTLDGDNVRHGLNKDLGFTDADRVENIRRVGEVARLMSDAGLTVLVSFISPFLSERRMAREMAVEGEFIEVYVDTPLNIAEKRDVKGLYKKARAGEIKNFTGIDSPYEPPIDPELRVDTASMSAEEAADAVLNKLATDGFIDDVEN